MTPIAIIITLLIAAPIFITAVCYVWDEKKTASNFNKDIDHKTLQAIEAIKLANRFDVELHHRIAIFDQIENPTPEQVKEITEFVASRMPGGEGDV